MCCRVCKYVTWLLILSAAMTALNLYAVPALSYVADDGASRFGILAFANALLMLLFLCFKPKGTNPKIMLSVSDNREAGVPIVINAAKKDVRICSGCCEVVVSACRYLAGCRDYQEHIANDNVAEATL